MTDRMEWSPVVAAADTGRGAALYGSERQPQRPYQSSTLQTDLRFLLPTGPVFMFIYIFIYSLVSSYLNIDVYAPRKAKTCSLPASNFDKAMRK
jgi:hypothetical protein